MKLSLALIAVGAAIAGAWVPPGASNLAQCGQTCLGNMVDIARTQWKCSDGDVQCYCANPDFFYGIRDCSNKACPQKSDADAAIAFGSSFCQSAGVDSPSGSSPSTPPILPSPGPAGSSVTTVTVTTIITSPLLATVTGSATTRTTTTGMTTMTGIGPILATSSAPPAAADSPKFILTTITSTISHPIPDLTTITSSVPGPSPSLTTLTSTISNSPILTTITSTVEPASSVASTPTSDQSTTTSASASAPSSSEQPSIGTVTSSVGFASPIKTAAPMLGFAALAAVVFV